MSKNWFLILNSQKIVPIQFEMPFFGYYIGITEIIIFLIEVGLTLKL
jgi:hypothetical protein